MTYRSVYLDTETTGLDPDYDELLEIAIIGDSGEVLFNTLIRPSPNNPIWPEAEAIHGITPEMVADAPALSEIAHQIEAAVKGQNVIIYNAGFDTGFLGSLLSSANSIQCCMEAWAEHVGEWSDYHGSYRWQKLTDAANAVHFEWPGEAHRALADSLACRAVWRYLVDPVERKRVDVITEDKHNARLAAMALNELERKEKARLDAQSKLIGRFIEHWWLRQYGSNSHWARKRWLSEVEDELAIIFFGKSLASLKLEEQFEITYHNQKAIPSHLKPASHFPKDNWYQAELSPCAAYIGKKRAWPLYDISEKERIRSLYPLRFACPALSDTEVLLTKTTLKKSGFSEKEIDALEPVAERQNPNNFEWYLLYKLEKAALPDAKALSL
ncbi:3'-5' exonuclease [Photorhabdus laumondii]|uniref:3'-5' exonuclease n=1 Tax=Photorhabdus laumondii TaxID=2218628 RepID=UPI0033148CD6